MNRREFTALTVGGVAAGWASSASAEGELVDVKTELFKIKDYRLENGTVMPAFFAARRA